MSCKYNNCKHCGYKSECEIYKENAELKEKNNNLVESSKTIISLLDEIEARTMKQLAKAKELIKDYMIIAKADHTTVCSVPKENRCINVLKLNEQAEQFLKESK